MSGLATHNRRIINCKDVFIKFPAAAAVAYEGVYCLIHWFLFGSGARICS